MLAVLNFISTRAVIVVENLVLSLQGGYHACEVSLSKVATTLHNESLVEQGNPSRVTTQLYRCWNMMNMLYRWKIYQ